MKNGAGTFQGLIHDERGLTLIELMIVLVLSLLLMAAVFVTYQVQRKTSDVQQEVAALQQDVRAVQDILARDVRQAGCDPMMNGTPGLVAADTGPLKISFTMDLNGDGDIVDEGEQVKYTYSGTTLTRASYDPTSASNWDTVAMSARVTDFGLTYRNVNGAVIPPTGGSGAFLLAAEADNVRTVEIRVEMQSTKRDPDLNDFIRRSMTRQIRMRNLGL